MVRHLIDRDILVIESGAWFSTDDIVAAFDAARRSPGFPNVRTFLFDNRGSKESASVEEIVRRIQLVQTLAPDIGRRIAIVVDGDLHFGLGRMAAALGAGVGIEMRVFRDLDEGKRWLRGAGPDVA